MRISTTMKIMTMKVITISTILTMDSLESNYYIVILDCETHIIVIKKSTKAKYDFDIHMIIADARK